MAIVVPTDNNAHANSAQRISASPG